MYNMKNVNELKNEFALIPEYQIENLMQCSTDELQFELGYCYWQKGNRQNIAYNYQMIELIENYLLNKIYEK